MIRRVWSAVVLGLMPLLAACAPLLSRQNDAVDLRPVTTAGGLVRLAVQEMGAGEPVLLLHGLGASRYSWRHIAPALAARHRVIAVDLKGFGASDKPADGRYSIFDQAALVEHFMAQEDLRGVTVVGHSYGGGVALALAMDDQARGSGRIARMVLIDSVAYRQPLPFFFRLLRVPVIAELGIAAIPPEVQAAKALAVAYYDDSRITRETVLAYAAPLYSDGARQALLETVSQLTPNNIEAFSERYRTLTTPALLIWCAHDRIVPLRFGERLHADLPNARLEVIGKCGHIPQEEQPEATLAAMGAFLQR